MHMLARYILADESSLPIPALVYSSAINWASNRMRPLIV